VGAVILLLAAAAFFVPFELFFALPPKLFRSELNAATTEVCAVPARETAMAQLKPNFLKEAATLSTPS
jgi:hypothetical protein